jgi:hypothetical protein
MQLGLGSTHNNPLRIADMVNASLTHFNERFCAQIFANQLSVLSHNNRNRKDRLTATPLNFTLSSQSRSVWCCFLLPTPTEQA